MSQDAGHGSKELRCRRQSQYVSARSVKEAERRRRDFGDKLVLQGKMTKRPSDWKAFMTNDENKQQLIKLLLRVWGDDEITKLERWA